MIHFGSKNVWANTKPLFCWVREQNANDNRLPPDTDDEGEFGLVGDIEVVALAGFAVQPDLITLLDAVLLYVLLSTLEHQLTLLLVFLIRIQ